MSLPLRVIFSLHFLLVLISVAASYPKQSYFNDDVSVLLKRNIIDYEQEGRNYFHVEQIGNPAPGQRNAKLIMRKIVYPAQILQTSKHKDHQKGSTEDDDAEFAEEFTEWSKSQMHAMTPLLPIQPKMLLKESSSNFNTDFCLSCGGGCPPGQTLNPAGQCVPKANW